MNNGEEGCDVFNRSRSEMFQVEDVQLVGFILVLQPLIALITRSAVKGRTIFKGFLLVSLVTIRVALKEVCLPQL